MLIYNLYYLNFARRLILRLYVIMRVGGGKGSNTAAPLLALPTALPQQQDFLLTLCKIVKRALFSSSTNFLIVAASFSYCFCTQAASRSHAFASAFFLRASAALSRSSFTTYYYFFLYNVAAFFNSFLSNFLSFSYSSLR